MNMKNLCRYIILNTYPNDIKVFVNITRKCIPYREGQLDTPSILIDGYYL